MFRIIDDNGSRTLDREELMKGLYDFGLKFTKAEVTQIISDIDRDRSGSVSFNEFLQALRVSTHCIDVIINIANQDNGSYKQV